MFDCLFNHHRVRSLSHNSLLMLLLSSELMARWIEVTPSLTHGSSRVAMPGGLEMLMALCKC